MAFQSLSDFLAKQILFQDILLQPNFIQEGQETTRGNGFKLKEGKLKIGHKEDFFWSVPTLTTIKPATMDTLGRVTFTVTSTIISREGLIGVSGAAAILPLLSSIGNKF